MKVYYPVEEIEAYETDWEDYSTVPENKIQENPEFYQYSCQVRAELDSEVIVCQIIISNALPQRYLLVNIGGGYPTNLVRVDGN